MRNLFLFTLLAVCGWKAVDHFVLKPRAYQAAMKEMAHDELIMYSRTTCGFCTEKRNELRAAGIRFRERFFDKDESAQKEFWERMRRQGFNEKSVGTPSFDVGGKLMINNPSLESIIKHLPQDAKSTRG